MTKKHTHYLRGKRAQSVGKQFEQSIIRTCHRSGIAVKKSDPPMRMAGGKVWRERTGVDFVLGLNGIAVFVDAKSTDTDRISHSLLKPHQLNDLSYWQSHGFTSGFIVYFRGVDAVCFIPISDLLKVTPGQSIKNDQCIYLGNSLDFELGRIFSNPWEKMSCPQCRRIK